VQFLILSDLHANWHALESVLNDAEGDYQKIICCGDIVGYNPQPGRVLDWTKSHCAAVIRGNHDKVIAGIEGLEWFNEVAQAAARWSMEAMSKEQLEYLRSLAEGPAFVDGFEIWHGSPSDEDEYLSTPQDAAPRFSALQGTLGFFGHTHLQGGFFAKQGRVGAIAQVKAGQRERVLELEPDNLYMINPGSVGQPRDRDRRAAYALYDPDQRTVTFRRTEYPVQQTAAEIRAAGLPDVLGLRLFAGM
jgi:predicted phosphodiesterase